jgi:hypothetical protein
VCYLCRRGFSGVSTPVYLVCSKVRRTLCRDCLDLIAEYHRCGSISVAYDAGFMSHISRVRVNHIFTWFNSSDLRTLFYGR